MNKRYTFFIFGLIIATLLPYIYAACYIVPLADDYSMSCLSVSSHDLCAAVSHMYLKWNGRYASDFFILANPYIRWGTTGYELAALLMMVAGLLTNYIVIRRLIDGEAERWLAAMALMLPDLFQLPDLSEGIYWYTGYMTYYTPALLFMFIILLLSDIIQARWEPMSYLKAPLILLLTVIIAGCNEPIAVILVLFFAALSLFVFHRYPHIRAFSILCLLTAIGGTMLVVMAPGNDIRAGYYHFDRSIPKILLMSHLQILRFAADWISDLPFIFLSAVVVIRSHRIRIRWIDSIRSWWILTAIYLIMLLCIILPYWGTGVLGQQRSLDMAYFFFIPLTFLLLVKVSRSQWTFRLLPYISSERIPAALIAISVVCMALTKNGYKIDYDIVYGTLPKYKIEQTARENLLKAHLRDKTYSLSPVQTKPLSITLYNEGDFPWMEQCERGYLFEVEKRDAHR